jgi:hypothetical protein
MQGPPTNASSSTNPSPYPNDSNLWSALEMDVGPDLSSSDRHPSASELPSPATMNSSSNTSFTPPSLDRGSTQVHPQYNGALGELHNLPHLSKAPSTTSGASNASQNATNPSADVNGSYLNLPNDHPTTDTMGIENPFDFSLSWRDVPQTQKPQGTDPFTNDQLDQMIEGMGFRYR